MSSYRMLFLFKMEAALNSLRKEEAQNAGGKEQRVMGCWDAQEWGRRKAGWRSGRNGRGWTKASTYHNEAEPEATVFFAPAHFPSPLLGFILKSNFRSAFLLRATKRSGR